MSAETEAALRERANDLYWGSEESVSSIADDLDLSKGALYGLVTPRPSGLPCPRCSAEMEYPNRTARDKGFLVCPECDLEEDEELVRVEWREAARRSGDPALVVSPGSGETARRPPALALQDPAVRRRVLAGTALLGAAAGLALALWARRK
jgi:hypothetical protein